MRRTSIREKVDVLSWHRSLSTFEIERRSGIGPFVLVGNGFIFPNGHITILWLEGDILISNYHSPAEMEAHIHSVNTKPDMYLVDFRVGWHNPPFTSYTYYYGSRI